MSSVEGKSCNALRDSEVMVNLIIPLTVDNSLSASFTQNLSSQPVLHTFWQFSGPYGFLVSSCILDISIFLIESITTFYILSDSLLF